MKALYRPFLALLFFVGPALAEPPAGYYDTVDTSSAATLRATLHEVIDDHTRFPYTSASMDTWDILEIADENPAESDEILDLYRNAGYPKAGGGNDNYNCEHTWPNSYGFPDDNSSNYPYTDCHALFLSDSGYNSSRGNTLYRYCPTCDERTTVENGGRGGGSGVYPGWSNWRDGSGSSGSWETWIGRRGEVARALLYLDVRYEGGAHGGTGAAEPDLILTDNEDLIHTVADNAEVAYMGVLSDLLAWHREDPVDQLERMHHEAVYLFQGNRNPFIDHPEWACIFDDTCTSPLTGLIIPGFEVDVDDPEGPTTLIAVRNVSNDALAITVAYYGENASGPALRVDEVSLAARQTYSADLRSNLSGLDPDGDGTATGIVLVNQVSGGAVNLEGDYLRVDSGNDFATGERAVRPEDFCTRQEIRFLDFGSGTKLRLLVDQPRGVGAPSLTYTIISEAGQVVKQADLFTAAHLNVVEVADLVPGGQRFGTIVLDFSPSGTGWVSASYSAFGRFSVELNGACRDR